MIDCSTLIDIFFSLLPFLMFFIAVKRRMLRSTTLLFLNKLIIQVAMTICIKIIHFSFKLLINGNIFSITGYFRTLRQDLFPSVKIIIYFINILHSQSLIFSIFSIFGIYSRIYFNHISISNLLLITIVMILMEIIGRKKVYLRDEDRYSYKCMKKKLMDVPNYKFSNIERNRFR